MFVPAPWSTVSENGIRVVCKVHHIAESLQVSAQTETGDRLKVGMKVRLTANFESVPGQVSSGSLRPGDVGTLLQDDHSSNPYRVDFNGVCHWYQEGTLECAGKNLSHVVKPSLANVKEAEIMFELAHEPGSPNGREGILFGVTTCEYDVAQGTSGAADTFMYHCKDGQKYTNRREPHALHATCSSTGYTNTVANCNIIILKFSRAAAQDNSEAALTVYDIDNDGQRRQCGPGPLAVGLPDDKEFFFCCDTFAPGQGATILSMEVDGVQLVTRTPASIYPPDTVFETPTQSLLVGGEA
jgi:hypothetical protein